MKKEKDTNKHSFADLLYDIVVLIVLVFILECIGCGICKKVGGFIGDGYREFINRSETITNNGGN